MILIVDEEAQGSKEEFCSVDKLKRDCYNALQLELYHAELLEERR